MYVFGCKFDENQIKPTMMFKESNPIINNAVILIHVHVKNFKTFEINKKKSFFLKENSVVFKYNQFR